jgi:O-antigen/teichoic acid export membrane protein
MKWTPSKIKSLLRMDLSLVAIATVVSAVMGAVFWLTLAYFLDAEKYGEVNYLLAIGGVFGAVASFGGDIAIVKLTVEGKTRAKSEVISFIFITTSVLAILALIVANSISVSLQVLGTIFFLMAYSEFLGYKFYGKYAIVQIGQKVIQVGLGIPLYFLLGLDGIIYGYALSYLIFSYKYFSSLREFTLRFTELKSHLKFMLHNYAILIARTLMLYSDKLIILPLYGYNTIGLYQIAAQFMQMASIVPLILFDYLLPQEVSRIEKRKVKAYGMMFSGLIAVLMIVLAPYVVQLLFPSFIESTSAIRIISTGIIPMTYTMVVIPRLLSTGKSKSVMLSAVIFVSLQYLLIVILGGTFGLEGLAISMVIALTAQAVYVWFENNRCVPST